MKKGSIEDQHILSRISAVTLFMNDRKPGETYYPHSARMRYILTILAFFLVINSSAQKVKDIPIQPFTVLYAENAKNASGRILKSLDGVRMDEVLTVETGGTLSLVHATGFPVEITKDTTLIIQSLHNAIDLTVEKDKKKTWRRIVPLSVDHLFISKGIEARKHRLQITGHCADCNFDLEIIYPPAFVSQPVYYTGPVCIKWKPTNNAYTINVLTDSKKVIKTYRTSTPELVIEAQLLSDADNSIRVVLSDSVTTRHLPVKAFAANLEYPYPCDIRKASFALMAGLYLELHPRHDYTADAEKYFILATQLSDVPFYREMLDNYRKRQEQ